MNSSSIDRRDIIFYICGCSGKNSRDMLVASYFLLYGQSSDTDRNRPTEISPCLIGCNILGSLSLGCCKNKCEKYEGCGKTKQQDHSHRLARFASHLCYRQHRHGTATMHNKAGSKVQQY